MKHPGVLIVVLTLVVGGTLAAYLTGNLFPERLDPYRDLPPLTDTIVPTDSSSLPLERDLVIAALTYLSELQATDAVLATNIAADDPLLAFLTTLHTAREAAIQELLPWHKELVGTTFVARDTTGNDLMRTISSHSLPELRSAYLESLIVSHLSFLETYGGLEEETIDPDLAELALLIEELLLLEVTLFEEALAL